MVNLKSNQIFVKEQFIAPAIAGIQKKNQKVYEIKDTIEGRLTALGMVATGIAHELNSPLATVKACAEGLHKRLEKGEYDPALFKNYLKIIEEEINQCSIITGNILRSVQELEKKNKENVDVHDCLDKAINTVSLQGRCRDISIVKDFDENMQVITGNESGLRQVFLTIIINALDSMKKKGTLRLETHIKEDSVVINIINTGPPISHKHIDKIFNPYFTTKVKEGGTGLGLFLAKNIIRDSGGTIQVSSDNVSGTIFTIVLPY